MAQADYFLKLDGTDGESTDDKHKGEIDIISWHMGVTNEAHSVGGGSGSGKAVVDDMSFTAKLGKHSAKLHLACLTGQHIPKGVLICRKAGGGQQEYLKITLTDILVSSYSLTGGETDHVPNEQFTLNFSEIDKEYKVQKPDGSTAPGGQMGYNTKTNKPK